MIRKTAIIIGASSDIGLATAKKFAKKGYNLALTYNTHYIDFGKELNVDSDIEIKAYKLNLLENHQVEDFFEAVKNDFQYFESLVYCSGVAQKRKIIFDITNDEIDTLFEVNLKSAIKAIRAFTKLTIGKNPSNIVLVGSFVDKNGCSCESVYTSTKSGMSGLCKSLSTELGSLDIRCNVVAPGFIDTKMNNNLSEEEKQEVADMTPLKRLGTVDDVANAIYFFCSEEASFITGQTLYVDGGLILD